MPGRVKLTVKDRATGSGLPALPGWAAPVLLLLVVALAAPPARAQGGSVTVTGVRSWPAPANTRVVFDLSAEVTLVAPDSGETHELAVSIPGLEVLLGGATPSRLAIGDGVVDSVQIETGVAGAIFRLWFRDTASFRVFTLPAEEDKPFRVVVDVARPGAEAAEAQRLARIAAEKRRDRVRIVAIDAGHGGEDAGARGPGGVLEKHVTLGVARALAEELESAGGVRAVLTRDGDYFIPLRDRYRQGEKVKADLFISIHANSSRRRGRGNGTEVYFLSQRGAIDQADADFASVENAADLVGGVPPESEDDLVSILYDVKRASAMQQSQLLAEALLEHIAADRRLESRGVKQAGFMVLKSVEFPSVLVEVAFINNPYEARLLRNPAFQRQMAKQLAVGVKTYLQRAGMSRPTGSTEDGGY